MIKQMPRAKTHNALKISPLPLYVCVAYCYECISVCKVFVSAAGVAGACVD